MATRVRRAILLAGLGLTVGACTEPPKPQRAAAGSAPAGPSPVEAPAPVAVEASAESPDAVSDPATADPLGSRFKDPAWYSKELIPHTKIVQDGRSEARDDGTFSSALVLQLEPGMSPAACVQHLVAKVEGDGLSFGEPETGEDGRLTVRAENDRYRVTFVCGAAKGTPTAYVGYEWKPGV